jgi:hypothetical protein
VSEPDDASTKRPRLEGHRLNTTDGVSVESGSADMRPSLKCADAQWPAQQGAGRPEPPEPSVSYATVLLDNRIQALERELSHIKQQHNKECSKLTEINERTDKEWRIRYSEDIQLCRKQTGVTLEDMTREHNTADPQYFAVVDSS